MCGSGLGLGLARDEATRPIRRVNTVKSDMIVKMAEEELAINIALVCTPRRKTGQTIWTSMAANKWRRMVCKFVC